MDNEIRKRDVLIASTIAGSLTGIAISVTLHAIYHNQNYVARSASVLELTIYLAIINLFSNSIKLLTPMEYHMFNVVLKEIATISLFFSIIVLTYSICYMFNEIATLRFAIIPIILFGLVASIVARNRAIKMIYPPRP